MFRYVLRPSRGILMLMLIALALPMSGCGGCGSSADDPEVAKKKEEEKKKKDKEKPKPDFELAQLYAGPADTGPNKRVQAAKPGHWLTINQLALANHYDLLGRFDSSSDLQTNGRMTPLALEGQDHWLQFERPAVLTKGQARRLTETLFVPRVESRPWIRGQLLTRDGSPVLSVSDEPLDLMPGYQYYFCLLAKEPTRYKALDRLWAMSGCATRSQYPFYRITSPVLKDAVLLPSNALAWTSIACLLWDDFDPGALSEDQKQALVDWLHWGGTLVISGPGSLDSLRGSFLDRYLPASAGGARDLTAAVLAPLAEFSTTVEGKKPAEPLKPRQPWSGVTLVKRPEAGFLPHSGELIADRRVGRGRVVVTAFHLKQRDLVNWPGYDSLWNACLLRHPRRKFVVDASDPAIGLVRGWPPVADHGEAEDVLMIQSDGSTLDHPMFDDRMALMTSGLRFASRDLNENGRFVADNGVLKAPQTTDVSQAAAVLEGNSADAAIETSGPGVGGWTDFGGVSSAARDSLRTAAGITIPRSDFVVWMIAAYLLVLGPLNWGLFRLLGRVEWAWVAAPVIAVAGAVVVTRAAHLNIGFARSLTEIDLLELQPDYARGHLTRYAALYTSLSTSYEVQMDDAQALAAPLALDRAAGGRRAEGAVTLLRQTDLHVSGFDVSSNSTAMLHIEQMYDVGGWISYTDEQARPWVYNRSKLNLHNVVALRRDGNTMEVARMDDLPPAEAGRPLNFHAAENLDSELASDWQSEEIPIQDPDVPRLSLVGLKKVVASSAGLESGEVRLIAEVEQSPPGMDVSPSASQLRTRVLVLAHLRHAPLRQPQRDINAPPKIKFEEDKTLMLPDAPPPDGN